MAIQKILIIIQRSNGDVLLAKPLIDRLQEAYPNARLDILVNDDTLAIARILNGIDMIHAYSYGWRKKGIMERLKNELALVGAIFRKYDLSINLTASDRSVLYAILGSRNAVSAVEAERSKSWWKRLFLSYSYVFDNQKHILLNNLTPAKLLSIEPKKIDFQISSNTRSKEDMQKRLKQLGISQFLIFHPSAQYDYKIYPQALRIELLEKLNQLNVPIIVTGAKSSIDMKIKSSLPKLNNLYDFIGETTLEEYIAVSELSLAYIGMDTLNMHIAAGQNKPIFAIFGPTLPHMWSPWSNQTQSYAKESHPLQKYGNVILFQADMPCVACGLAGCDDRHGKSECLDHIDPQTIFQEVSLWLKR